MVALFLSGVIAYRLLPLSALPEVSYPTIQILTLYPGASPDVMTTSVTAPLERQLGQIPGLTTMTSQSAEADISVLDKPSSEEERVLFASITQTESHRNHPDDHGESGHQNWPKTREAGLDGGL